MQPYNPADHTVDEVNTYLESADDAERERVLAAESERDGGGRITVNGYTDYLATRPEPEAAADDDATEDEARHRADTPEQAQAIEDAAAGDVDPNLEAPEQDGDQLDRARKFNAQPTTTKAATFAEAAARATPADKGYLGASPERDRTGRTDKGLSQANPNILKGGPIPDPRQGVDDSAALEA